MESLLQMCISATFENKCSHFFTWNSTVVRNTEWETKESSPSKVLGWRICPLIGTKTLQLIWNQFGQLQLLSRVLTIRWHSAFPCLWVQCQPGLNAVAVLNYQSCFYLHYSAMLISVEEKNKMSQVNFSSERNTGKQKWSPNGKERKWGDKKN